MIHQLQTKMVRLESRVAQLESGKYPYPAQPVWPMIVPGTMYGKLECPKCGRSLANLTGYVCSDNSCPTFMKATATTGG